MYGYTLDLPANCQDEHEHDAVAGLQLCASRRARIEAFSVGRLCHWLDWLVHEIKCYYSIITALLQHYYSISTVLLLYKAQGTRYKVQGTNSTRLDLDKRYARYLSLLTFYPRPARYSRLAYCEY